MARDVRLNKEVFDKRTYQKTIDTTFKELGVKTIQEQIDEQPTVQEFFNMYTELFYQINERGPDNSHEYLVKTSGEYISFEDKDELVEALQKEIANLRKELLQTQQDLADSLGDLAEASQPLPEIEEVEAPVEIPNPIADIIDTPEPTPTPTPTPTPDMGVGSGKILNPTIFLLQREQRNRRLGRNYFSLLGVSEQFTGARRNILF